jgi:hypothetical protein
MQDGKTERSNCSFTVQQTPEGKPILVMQFYQESILQLQGAVVGFDLLGGTQPDRAKKLAEMLNEHVLDMFVTSKHG